MPHAVQPCRGREGADPVMYISDGGVIGVYHTLLVGVQRIRRRASKDLSIRGAAFVPEDDAKSSSSSAVSMSAGCGHPQAPRG